MKLFKRKSKRLPAGFIVLTVLPTLTLTIIFGIVPVINGFALSFTNAITMRATGNAKFTGLENYIYMFARDSRFLIAIGNTFKLSLAVPICTIFLSALMAVILTQTRLKERGVYRVLHFLPSVISLTVVAVVWAYLFDPRAGGVFNTLTGLVGLGPVTWLGDRNVTLWCIAVVLIWQAAGYYMVMHIAALDNISDSVYEAAALDGATWGDKFFRITIPLMKDIIGITFVLSISGTLSISFILTSVMTAGGPGNASLVLPLYVYNMSFGAGANVGYAMALTVVSLALSAALSVLTRRMSYSNENMQGPA
jgi:N-acetylglucosamine transport system permease protein